MTNPQDNPGTPPQPTPSDYFPPPQPSTNPQPRRRRVKMLARKTVATGALLKKPNAKLKASQAQDSENSDDSFKSASEGEGTGSSDSKKAQNPPSEKVAASYNPKKRTTLTPKAPSTAKTTKKRKATSPTTTEIPLAKGRATRSKLKQSEEEL
ncbi:PREDICTED: uncharacterized protein LOC109209251 [Nicotiana attenuata]|uniref:uncharacterized protein LOC109209251 n=1 Tax=Nicotiana attenuata TaxID=49451 RepID=UPI000905C491|nr:PREDICTED: uncharacterized protein LOC109209251 [Nicotiana attenuata]